MSEAIFDHSQSLGPERVLFWLSGDSLIVANSGKPFT
jgi:hypothetical protein